MAPKKTEEAPSLSSEELNQTPAAELSTEEIPESVANDDTLAASSKVEEVRNETTTAVNGLPIGVTSIVIPYAADLAQGIELRMALRSIAKNTRAQINLVIIGDREPWMEDIAPIFTLIEHKRVSDNPQMDTTEKIKLAIASNMVSEDFIWSNDDIYFISEVTIPDIAVLKTKGVLNPKNYSGIYAANIQRTIDLLGGGSLRDFGTHTPCLFNKICLVELFEKYPELSTGGYLFSSVYFNTFFPNNVPQSLNWETDNWLLPVISQNPNKDKFNEILAKKKWLNNSESGYSDFLRDKLLELFPDASPFEGK